MIVSLKEKLTLFDILNIKIGSKGPGTQNLLVIPVSLLVIAENVQDWSDLRSSPSHPCPSAFYLFHHPSVSSVTGISLICGIQLLKMLHSSLIKAHVCVYLLLQSCLILLQPQESVVPGPLSVDSPWMERAAMFSSRRSAPTQRSNPSLCGSYTSGQFLYPQCHLRSPC